jgi:hypothetical protein
MAARGDVVRGERQVGTLADRDKMVDVRRRAPQSTQHGRAASIGSGLCPRTVREPAPSLPNRPRRGWAKPVKTLGLRRPGLAWVSPAGGLLISRLKVRFLHGSPLESGGSGTSGSPDSVQATILLPVGSSQLPIVTLVIPLARGAAAAASLRIDPRGTQAGHPCCSRGSNSDTSSSAPACVETRRRSAHTVVRSAVTEIHATAARAAAWQSVPR